VAGDERHDDREACERVQLAVVLSLPTVKIRWNWSMRRIAVAYASSAGPGLVLRVGHARPLSVVLPHNGRRPSGRPSKLGKDRKPSSYSLETPARPLAGPFRQGVGDRHFRRRAVGSTLQSGKKGATWSTGNPRVLVVDDDESVRGAYIRVLTKAVRGARSSDGAAALELLSRVPSTRW